MHLKILFVLCWLFLLALTARAQVAHIYLPTEAPDRVLLSLAKALLDEDTMVVLAEVSKEAYEPPPGAPPLAVRRFFGFNVWPLIVAQVLSNESNFPVTKGEKIFVVREGEMKRTPVPQYKPKLSFSTRGVWLLVLTQKNNAFEEAQRKLYEHEKIDSTEAALKQMGLAAFIRVDQIFNLVSNREGYAGYAIDLPMTDGNEVYLSERKQRKLRMIHIWKESQQTEVVLPAAFKNDLVLILEALPERSSGRLASLKNSLQTKEGQILLAKLIKLIKERKQSRD